MMTKYIINSEKVQKMKFYFFIILLHIIVDYVHNLTNPIVNPSNANFQTGISQLSSSGSPLGTSLATYNFLLTNAMPTNSLQTAIGIVTNEMTLSGQQMGFQLTIVSVDATQMFIQATAVSATNPVTLLKVCYLVTSYVELHVNHMTYTFNAATDSVLNNAISDWTTCPSSSSGTIECRSKGISLPYASIGNTMKALAVISGFAVNSFQNGGLGNANFGLGLIWPNVQATSLGVTVIVYGRALLSSVSTYYLSYEQESLNILSDKVIIAGTMSVGCSINWGGTLCQPTDPLNINTSVITTGTGFGSFYATNYFYGFSNYIGGYDATSGYGMKFTVGNPTLSGTAYQSSFSYYGNIDGKFRMTFSYLILLQFYCPSSGTTDIYYTRTTNQCNSTCNGWLTQYFDVNRKCQSCGIYCYKCSGGPNLCDDCYVSQNRIINGDDCVCNVLGYYDDGSSVTCPKCHYSCRSCTGPSASQCIDCSTTSFRTIDLNSCFCNPRYYDNGANTICLACHYTCLTCTANAATNCQTCAASDFRQPLASNNSCPCMIGYYDKGSPNNVCGLCHYSCWTCNGPSSSQCTSCNTTAQFRSASGGSCPCVTGYYDKMLPVCDICHVTCLKCNGPTKFDCTACDNLKFRGGPDSGQCKCKTGYYELGTTCYPCHYSCYNCTGGTKFQCINCNNVVTFRNWNGSNSQCYCIAGYFDTGTLAQCQMCDRTCLTCQNSSTTCLTCDPLKNRVAAGTTCPCISGYVDTLLASGLCPKCHYSCLTCTGTAATQCASCNPTWRTLTGGQCLCLTHTYDNGITQQCYPCHAECLQCTAQYDTTCKSCDPLYLRQIVGLPPKPCTCIQRHFENNGALLCDTCHFSCLTCSIISTNCTSCDSTTNHRWISGQTCLCESHYYEVNTQSCSQCISTCQNCSTNPDNCTSCYADRYLLGNKCLCNLGTWEDTFLVCQPCHYFCKTCENSSTTCLSCPAFSFRTLNNANCPCDFGYYDNNTVICAKCPYQCSGCTGPDPPLCIACPASSFRTYQADKSCPCDAGYYDDGVSPTCKPCKNTCLTCSAFSVCTSCYPVTTQFRTLLNNYCRCTAGYYDNNINPICQLCHYSCQTCNGPLNTNCLTCKPNRLFQVGSSSCPCNNGFYETAQLCYPCDASCKTCSSLAMNCTSCDLLTRYLFNNKCLCREGYYENGGTCAPCDVRCGSCSISPTNCLTCNSSHLTMLSGSSCVCLTNQFQNPVTLICSSCHFKCMTCFGLTENACLTCNSALFRTLNPVTTTCDCNAGYFDTGNATCAQCHSTCLTCYGPTQNNCSSCSSAYTKIGSSCKVPLVCSSGFYYNGYCVSACPNTTYPSSNNCQTCIYYCKTCESATICTSCVQGYYFNATQKTCNVNCLQGSYINRVTRTCEFCPTGCQVCAQRSSQVVCPKCKPSYFLYNHTKCVDTVFCASPYFVTLNGKCYGCEKPCQTCTNISYNGCLSCVDGFSLYSGECLAVCPVGFFSLDRVCVQCQSRCQSCSSTACLLCKEGFYLTPQQINPKCVTIGYFFNPLTNQEEKCHPNCYSCTNSSFSSCITCQKFRGDEAQMAIDGYCDCWKDSIDIGDGKCSFDSYEQVQTYTKVLKSTTDSALYMAGVGSVFSANFLSSGLFLLYQQSYSTMYFVNSSSVLQTDQYLSEALNKNFNFYLNSQRNKNSSRVKYQSRLLVTLQGDVSLFSRGDEFQIYLFDWAFYTVIILGSLWLVVILTNCLFSRKCVVQNEILRTVLATLRKIFQQSAIIVIHLLTISEISLYATVTFKFILSNSSQLNVNWTKFALSMLLAAYYLGYILRLIVGCCTLGKDKDPKKRNEYNPLTLLTCYFEEIQVQEQIKRAKNNKTVIRRRNARFAQIPTIKKLYIPLLMIRLVIGSVLVVVLSSKPLLQVGSILGVMVIWTIYSMIFCPYNKFGKIFIHINEIVYLGQIGVMLYSVMSQQGSRIIPAYISLILNGIQIAFIGVFSILLAVQLIYGICKQKKGQSTNRVQNIYFTDNENENNNSELYLNDENQDFQDKIRADSIDENIFNKELEVQEMEQNQLNTKEKQQQLHNVNLSDQKVLDNTQPMIKSFQNETDQGQVEIIIKKKYRAVRKNNNSSPTPLN